MEKAKTNKQTAYLELQNGGEFTKIWVLCQLQDQKERSQHGTVPQKPWRIFFSSTTLAISCWPSNCCPQPLQWSAMLPMPPWIPHKFDTNGWIAMVKKIGSRFFSDVESRVCKIWARPNSQTATFLLLFPLQWFCLGRRKAEQCRCFRCVPRPGGSWIKGQSSQRSCNSLLDIKLWRWGISVIESKANK